MPISLVAGAYLIEPEKLVDERGFFARAWCQREFTEQGLNSQFVQCNISFNQKKGTLRGLHYQVKPHEEVKLVRCTRGAIYDVIVDIRPDSTTFKQWVAIELTAGNYKTLYIPEGFAHGFQTLTDDTEVFYQMSTFYHAESARGIRWNSSKVNIQWPIENPIMSVRDREFVEWVSEGAS